MKKIIFILVCFLAYAVQARVGIIINKDLAAIPSVKSSIDQYITDLQNNGESVWIDSITFNDGNSRSELQQLRDTLRQHYLNDNLTGAVLVGNLPCAQFERYDSENAPKINIKNYWGEVYPVDYYFMDIDDVSDAAWRDDSTETTHPEQPNFPYKSDLFDSYTGDESCEIWVTRVIGHNIFHYNGTTQDVPFDEDGVIADYFNRTHIRMTQNATIPSRAVQIGDFKNWFDTTWAQLQNLNIPFTNLKFPHDKARIWETELRKGYEWATILEHSGSDGHLMGMDHGAIEWDFNRFGSRPDPWGDTPEDRSLLYMVDSTPLPPRVLFFQDMGCSNVKYNDDNCLGQMYAMLNNGLICFGSSKEYGPNPHTIYTQQLGSGACFGEAYRQHLNNDPNHLVQPANHCLVIIGAGTLKLSPYIPAAMPHLIIENVTMQPVDGEQPVLLHNSEVKLHADISTSDGSSPNISLLKLTWYGSRDSITGNDAVYTLDGHDAPMFKNGYKQGTYTIVLHAECPGYLPVNYKIESDAWSFSKVGTIDSLQHKSFHTNFHQKAGTKWNLHMRGASGDIGNTSDDFVYYYRNVNSEKFRISTKIEFLQNMTNPDAKAGVMLRSALQQVPQPPPPAPQDPGLAFTGSDPMVFFGVTNANGIVFQYRLTDGAAATRRSYPGYSPGATWVRLVKTDNGVYGYVSTDGSSFIIIDSVITNIFAAPIAGFAYSCNDPDTLWSTGERWANFADMQFKQINQIMIPPVFGTDSLILLDRVRYEADVVGAGKGIRCGIDDTIIVNNLYANGNVKMYDRSKGTGSITLSGTLTLINDATWTGATNENASVEFEPVVMKTLTVGSSPIQIWNGSTQTLTGGGSYGDLTVGGTLVLNQGDYTFKTITLYPDARLIINGQVILNAQNNVIISERLKISGVTNANQLQFYSNGSTFTVGALDLKANINAPNAVVTIGSSAKITGQVIGKTVILECDAKVYGQ